VAGNDPYDNGEWHFLSLGQCSQVVLALTITGGEIVLTPATGAYREQRNE